MSEVREAFELVFKLPDDVFWSGDGYLPKGEQPYAFESLDRACEMDSRLEGYSAAQVELAALREELAISKHNIASFLETMAKVCDLLGIDTEDAKHAEGNPSDVFFSHATALSKRLAAAEQRNADHLKLIAGLVEYADNLLSDVNNAWSYAGITGNPETHKDDDYAAAVALIAKPTESGASE